MEIRLDSTRSFWIQKSRPPELEVGVEEELGIEDWTLGFRGGGESMTDS
jgi:hypothetical protein